MKSWEIHKCLDKQGADLVKCVIRELSKIDPAIREWIDAMERPVDEAAVIGYAVYVRANDGERRAVHRPDILGFVVTGNDRMVYDSPRDFITAVYSRDGIAVMFDVTAMGIHATGFVAWH